MCILQDFEALTPNTLARTIETVSGGGLVVFLLKSMDSLRQLCTMAMDVHARYRTEAHADVVCRFNERFLLSLAQNPRCIVIDDRWNILPISKKVIHSLDCMRDHEQPESLSKEQAELAKLKVLLNEDDSYFAALVNLCKTLDQAKSLLHFCSALIDIANPFDKAKVAKKSNIITKLAQFDLSTQSLVTHLSDSETKPNSHRSASSAVVVVTAGRGRGKSAALGLGLAAAFDAGLPNMCVTAPSPENLITLMQFVLLGLTALKYEEHVDYTVHRSTDPDHNKAVVKIEVTRRSYRQSLVYLQPWEAASAGGGWQPDLFCIDEAAAIPLPTVRQMIAGPKLIFMASTINGYEGTGRSLSVKLIGQLRNECQRVDVMSGISSTELTKESSETGKGLQLMNSTRLLYEVSLKEAIRYANGDPVESWLNNLLCLDCGEMLFSADSKTGGIAPAPDECNLYYVNRDTLFAYHASTEVFLQRLMGLYVSSHYKNSPNDLQLLSDAPAHHIFCLLAPYDSSSGRVPEILCVIQVCLEGKINRDVVMRGLSRGLKPSGDLIPWAVSQQFCEPNFGELSGARIIRIATHPDYQSLGYGSRALQLLHKYYLGEIPLGVLASVKSVEDEQGKPKVDPGSDGGDDDEVEEEEEEEEVIPDNLSDLEEETPSAKKVKKSPGGGDGSTSQLLTEEVKRRAPTSLPPLLSRLGERQPEKLNYIGVSFGATPKLLRFWKRAGYLPVYLRQTMNELTGEFSCIMLSELRHNDGAGVSADWLREFYFDFCKRLIKLLPGPFRTLDAAYSLELLTNKLTRSWIEDELTSMEVRQYFSVIDLERLHRYLRSLLDFPMVADQLPQLANLYFLRRFPHVKLNKTQQVILCGLGVQRKSVEQLAEELERLLGVNGGLQGTKQRQSLVAGGVDGAFWSSGVETTSAGGLAKRRLRVDGQASTDQPSGGWARRIRGLLFVIIRELVKSLDESLKTTEDAGQSHLGKTMPDLPSASAPSYLETRGLSALKSDDDEEEADLGDEFVLTDATPGGTSVALADEAEQARRTELVRQLLREESDVQLARYQVRGSEKTWNAAIAGHGSELSALHVRIPEEKTKDSGVKRRREVLGDKMERKRSLRHSQLSTTATGGGGGGKRHKKGNKKHHG
ncbi:RNA cytidine acetyltransferase [Taenia crassiceps]|uniref:RNA cytidine acetyltransferase n=1 Tax=Taenia crassiceps TaxID=6207 RepID=A0ABR4QIY2_9CEST